MFSLVWTNMPCCFGVNLVLPQCQYWGVSISLTYESCVCWHACLKSFQKTPLTVFTRLSSPVSISVVTFQITMSFLEDLLEWFFSAGNEWFWCWEGGECSPKYAAGLVTYHQCEGRWPMGKSNNCGISSESGPQNVPSSCFTLTTNVSCSPSCC